VCERRRARLEGVQDSPVDTQLKLRCRYVARSRPSVVFRCDVPIGPTAATSHALRITCDNQRLPVQQLPIQG